MNIKKIIYLLFCFILLGVTLSACNSKKVMLDYVSFDETSIITYPDWIIIGEVVSVQSEKVNVADSDPITKKQIGSDLVTYTVSEIKVLEVVKGDLNVGDIVKVKQRGDEKHQPDKDVIAGPGYLIKGAQDFLFLKECPNTPNNLINPWQGVIEIKDAKTKLNPSNNFFQSDISKDEFVKQLKEKVQYLKDNPPTEQPYIPSTINPDLPYSTSSKK